MHRMSANGLLRTISGLSVTVPLKLEYLHVALSGAGGFGLFQSLVSLSNLFLIVRQ